MMTRRGFVAGAPAVLQSTASRQRNVLLLIADDLGLHTGAYGDPAARTPNLDRMAQDGVRFTHGFCTTASCSPSRSVMLTGLHNHASGQYGLGHSVHNFGLMPNIVPVPRLLKSHGYATGVIGKLHVNAPGGFGWDLDAQGEGRSVKQMADQARGFISNHRAKPWYLHVGYTDPHRAGPGFANRAYPGVTANKFDPAKVPVPSFLPDNAQVRSELAEYYESANRLDQGIGFMFDVLRETGQLENTLVVFVSDNGMPFANAKTNVYDAGTRLPLIVRSPEQNRRGVVNDAMVSWVDLAPTILDWARAEAPYPLHGRSLLPVLEQAGPPGWDEAFFSHTFHEVTMYYPMRAVRTRRYKYIRNLTPELEYPLATDLWSSRTWQAVLDRGGRAMVGKRPVAQYLHRPGEELYEVAQDPDEVNNLATDPAHAGALDAMRAKLRDFRSRTKDPWTILDFYRGAAPAAGSQEQENLDKVRKSPRAR